MNWRNKSRPSSILAPCVCLLLSFANSSGAAASNREFQPGLKNGLVTRELLGVELPRTAIPGILPSVDLSPDGTRLAFATVTEKAQAAVWNCDTGKRQWQFDGAAPVSISPDGARLACGKETKPILGQLQVFNIATALPIKRWEQVGENIQWILWTSDSKQLVVGSSDGRVRQFEPKTKLHLYSFLPQKLSSGAILCATSRLLFYGSRDDERKFKNVIAVRDLEAKALLSNLPARDVFTHHTPPCAVDRSFDGVVVASSDEGGKTCFWDAGTGELVAFHQFPAPAQPAFVKFHPDGRRLIVAHHSGVLQCWDTIRGVLLGQLKVGGEPCSLSLSADGRRLALAWTDCTARVYDISAWPIPETKPLKLAVQELEDAWQQLEQVKSAKTQALFAKLIGGGPQTVAFLKTKLKPAPALNPKDVPLWIKQLDHGDAEKCAQARANLAAIGFSADPQLRDALETKPSKQAKEQIDKLLAVPGLARTGDALRRMRALRVLAQIGTSEALDVIKSLAQGGTACYETLLAKTLTAEKLK